jgi:hypothetical protein
LADIFVRKKKLEDEEFVERTGRSCPELDGGDIFFQANPQYDRNAMQLTRGLGHALVDLHLDGVIRMHCNPDSGGWSLELSSPPNDGKTLLSERLDFVEWIDKQ